jgi:transcriptional regulator with XRE-family HTH domain
MGSVENAVTPHGPQLRRKFALVWDLSAVAELRCRVDR